MPLYVTGATMTPLHVKEIQYLREIEQAATLYLQDMTSDNAQVLSTRLDIYHAFLKAGK